MRRRYYCYILCAALLTAAGCDKEQQPDATGGGSRIIVDYTLGTDGIATRAGEDDRINSLHYLVYDVDNDRLVKQREIPGIGEVTAWPLTREKMTWAQRQALQDTLALGTRYRVLFVANAAPALFGDGQAALLQGLDQYSTAVLTLPATAFGENNLYYFWSHEIGSTATAHETPYLCNVMLQRIVTRTHVRCVAMPDKADTEGYEAFVRRAIGTSLYETLKPDIENQVQETINKFKELTNTAVGFGTIPLLYAGDVTAMKNALDNHKTDIADGLKEQIISVLYSRIANSTLLSQKYRSWNLENGSKAEVHYQANTRVNRFPLNGGAASNATPDETVLTTTAAADGAFTFYALSAGETEAEQEGLNIIEKVCFFTPDNETNAVIEEASTWNAMQGKNTSKTAECNPIGNIQSQGESKTSTDCYIDLTPFFPETWQIPSFEQTMIDVIINPTTERNAFGDSFSHFKFTIELPMLNEAEGGLAIAPAWTILPE